MSKRRSRLSSAVPKGPRLLRARRQRKTQRKRWKHGSIAAGTLEKNARGRRDEKKQMKRAYHGGEIDALCGLPPLLANWRQRRYFGQCWYSVCREAPGQSGAGVIRSRGMRLHLAGETANGGGEARERRLLAGRLWTAKAAVLGAIPQAVGKGHGVLPNWGPRHQQRLVGWGWRGGQVALARSLVSSRPSPAQSAAQL